MGNLSAEKVAFAASVLVLTLLYGYSARQNGFFPDSLIRQVQQEASDIWYRPMLTERIYDRSGVDIRDSTALQPGLTFINALWNDPDGPRPGFNLINRHG